MAVRLKEALPERDGTQPGPIPAALYNKARHGLPRCFGCGTELTHTSTYTKNGGSTVVSAHFGLRKHHKHASGCRYDIDATLQKIVAKSREVRDLGTAALVEHVGTREREAVEFRLHVLLAGLEPGRLQGRQDAEPEVAYAYRESDQRLTAYMNCVESIVMVADVVSNDAELEEKVQVVFNGERIPWRDFFYSLGEHRRLWRAREKIQGRPVTVEFERRELERNAPTPYRANGQYQISGQFVREEGDRPYNLQVQLQVEDKALADAIWSAKRVAVCSVPRFKLPDFGRSRPGGYPPFAHIVLPVREWSQIFAVGGGPLEAPRSAFDMQPESNVPRNSVAERPLREASQTTVTDEPDPNDNLPRAVISNAEKQAPRLPCTEDTAASGDRPEHQNPEPDGGKTAENGRDEREVEFGTEKALPTPSESAPAPTLPSTEPAELNVTGTGTTREADLFAGKVQAAEEPVVQPEAEDGAATGHSATNAPKPSKPLVLGHTVSMDAASSSRETRAGETPLPMQRDIVTASPQKTIAQKVASHRNRWSLTQATSIVRTRATKAIEFGRSLRKRVFRWFGVKG